MTSLYHPTSLAKELRPFAVVIAITLLSFALIACGSSQEAAADEAPQATSEHVVERSDDHSASADHDAHADHSAHRPADHSAHHFAHPETLPAVASDKLPGTSIYHLSSAWTDHLGRPFELPDLRGGPAVFVMFYGDCTTACPLLVKAAEDISDALSDEQRATTRFVMVTFDTDRDTPEKLAAYAADKGLDLPTWHWLVGSPLQTRQLATLLGVQYRDAGNGMFAHSNVVTVVDSEGVPTARLEGLGIDLGPAIAAVAAAAAR